MSALEPVARQTLQREETPNPLPLAAAAIHNKRWADALPLAKAALQREESFEAWVLCGIAQARLKDLREAITCFQKALEKKPSDLQTWVDLGECSLGINDFQRAGMALGRAIDLDPNGTHPAGRRARVLAGRAIVKLRNNK